MPGAAPPHRLSSPTCRAGRGEGCWYLAEVLAWPRAGAIHGSRRFIAGSWGGRKDSCSRFTERQSPGGLGPPACPSQSHSSGFASQLLCLRKLLMCGEIQPSRSRPYFILLRFRESRRKGFCPHFADAAGEARPGAESLEPLPPHKTLPPQLHLQTWAHPSESGICNRRSWRPSELVRRDSTVGSLRLPVWEENHLHEASRASLHFEGWSQLTFLRGGHRSHLRSFEQPAAVCVRRERNVGCSRSPPARPQPRALHTQVQHPLCG